MFNRRTYKYFFLLILFAALGGFIPPPTRSNGGIGRHEGLVLSGKNLSAYKETYNVELRKFREALTDNADGNPEPSLIKEGAETRHEESKLQNAA